MKSKQLRERLEKLISRHNVYHVDEPEYLLNNDQLLNRIEAIVQAQAEEYKKMIEEIRKAEIGCCDCPKTIEKIDTILNKI